MLEVIEVILKHLQSFSKVYRLLQMLHLRIIQTESGELLWLHVLRRWLLLLFKSEGFLCHLSLKEKALELLVNASVYVNGVSLSHLSGQVVHLTLINNELLLARNHV